LAERQVLAALSGSVPLAAPRASSPQSTNLIQRGTLGWSLLLEGATRR